jgi:hypothetical protein
MLRSLAGTLSFTGDVVRAVSYSRIASGALSFAGSIARSIAYSRAVSGVLDWLGTAAAVGGIQITQAITVAIRLYKQVSGTIELGRKDEE